MYIKDNFLSDIILSSTYTIFRVCLKYSYQEDGYIRYHYICELFANYFLATYTIKNHTMCKDDKNKMQIKINYLPNQVPIYFYSGMGCFRDIVEISGS